MYLNQALDTAVKIEAELAECYRLMSLMDSREIFFNTLKILSQEEISHLNALKAGKNYLYQAPEEFGEVRTALEDLENGLSRIKEFHQALETGSMDLKTALQTMHSLEKSYEKVHLTTLMSIQNEELKRLFQALCNYDQEHRKRLERLLDQV